MKTKLLLSVLFTFVFCLLSSQVPQGFNYQAIARNSQGKELLNTALQVKVSILTDTTGFYATGGGTYIWEELQNVTTNSFGLFTILFGASTASKVQGSAASFSAIDWKASPLYIGTKIYYSGAWKYLGTTKLGSVPYSMVSGTVSGPITKLNIKGASTAPFDSALFEVKNKNGQTVFAVYNEGIRAYVDNGIAKGATKGGFAIGGFGTAKGVSQPYMMISPDSARIYVDETAVKGTKGGFAIGGFNTAKGSVLDFMKLTPDNYFIGHKSGIARTTGTYNSTLGFESGKSLNTGSSNIFIGYRSGQGTTTGSRNIFLGAEAGFNNTIGYDNIAIGTKADSSLASGAYNVMIGTEAGHSVSTGSWNSMLGFLAGNLTSTGGSQVLLGYQAGQLNTDGWNTMVGSLAGRASGSGWENTYIGLCAGEFATGYRNVFLGRWAGRNEYSNNSKLVIETNYEGTDNFNNALIYGDFISKYLRVNGALTSTSLVTSDDSPAIIGQHNITPYYGYGVKGLGGYVGVRGDATLAGTGYRYGVYGNASGGTTMNVGVYGSASGTSPYAGYFNGTVYGVSFTTTSDRNLKKNIIPLSGTLQKVLELQGVTYEWKSESELTSANLGKGDSKGDVKGENDTQRFNFPKGTQIGVIAQDVEKIVPELVQTDANGLKSVDYIKIVPLLIEAVKEQQKEIEELKALVNSLLPKK